MNTVFKAETVLRTCDCDIKGSWRPSSLFEATQEISQAHSEILGVGFFELRKKDIAWVLAKMHLQMFRYPKISDKVLITTWPGKKRRCYYARHYTFTSPDGGIVYGAASSDWVLVDLANRHMYMSDPEGFPMTENLDLMPPTDGPEVVKPLDTTPQFSTWQPMYHDIDVNGHVNNTRYIDRLCDMRPADYYRTHDICDLTINYNSEILPNTVVELEYRETESQMCLFGSKNGKKLFGISAAFSLTAR